MKKLYLLSGLLLASFASSAQLTGTKNIPGDYADLAAAITDLNTQGVGAGGVVLNVTANQTTTTGYVITASGTAASPILLKGNNKTITMTGSAAGTADAILALAGSDYVTINGFVLNGDANTEWGILLGKKNTAAPYDGSQNNAITGNSITLSKTSVNSIGVYAANIVPGSTTVLSTTGIAASDANSNNTVSFNTIGNVYIGVFFSGAAASAGYDAGNTMLGNGVTDFGSTGANVYGIRAANFSSLLIKNNNVQSSTSVAATAYGIQVGATSGTALIDSNTVQMTATGTTSALNGIGSTGATGTITISNNTLSNCSYTSATSAAFNGIVSTNTTAPGPTLVISSNTIASTSLSGTGLLYGIDAGVATSATISGNNITGNTKTGGGGSLFGIRLGNTTTISVTGNTISGNSIPNTSGSNTASLHGIVAAGSLSGITETYSGNTIINQSIGGNTTSTNCTMYGIFPGSSSMGTRVISGNIIGGFTNAAGGNVFGINQVQSFDISNNSTASINTNKVYDLNGNSSNSSVSGIYIGSGQTVTVVNNLIGDLKAPAAFANNPLNGINVQGGSTVNVYYNSVWLNATSTGTSFGSSALNASTTTTLKLFNNILINTSTSNGSGVTAAYRRSGTTLSSYTGNNNIFYAGTPGAFNLIFFDGTTSGSSSNIQTLAAYQALVAPQDNNSKTENTPFISTTGTSGGFLHIASAAVTQASNGGLPVAGITTDFDGDTRNASTPDIGGDEFASAVSCDAPGTPAASNVTSSSATITFTPGSGTASFQWELRTGGACGSGSPLQSGTSTTGTFNLSNLSGGTNYTICVRRDCGAGSFSSWASATFSTTACPTITVPPTGQSVCEGEPFSLSVQTSSTPAGTTYQWFLGPNPVATATAANYQVASATAANAGSYTVTITSPGCTITSPAAVVTVNQKPTAAFTNNTPGCAPATVTFINGTTGSGTLTYSWDFGDGSPLSATNSPTHIYTLQGIYQVKLVARTNAGCSDSVTHAVTIGCTTAVSNVEAGIADISLLPNAVHGPAVLQVHALRSVVINWTLVDGSGRILRRFTQRAAAGSTRLQLNFDGIAPGSYQLLGHTDKGKVTIVRFVRL